MSVFAFSGASGTGKSTLLADVTLPITLLAQGRGINVVFQEERARKVFAEQYAPTYGSFEELLKTDPLSYQVSLAEAFRDDAAEAKANPETIYIADRTGFDVACYTMLLGGQGEADAMRIDRIFDLLHSSLHIVDHVFLTMPFGGKAERDGFRPSNYEDPARRSMEENLFRHIGVLFPNTTVLPADRSERVKTVLDKVSFLIPAQ
jgi:predicted ATPase